MNLDPLHCSIFIRADHFGGEGGGAWFNVWQYIMFTYIQNDRNYFWFIVERKEIKKIKSKSKPPLDINCRSLIARHFKQRSCNGWLKIVTFCKKYNFSILYKNIICFIFSVQMVPSGLENKARCRAKISRTIGEFILPMMITKLLLNLILAKTNETVLKMENLILAKFWKSIVWRCWRLGLCHN